ncbi:MAG: glutamine synthetase [Clostridiales bacterium]|nr:glutamine synthetase [Clostridiales bacterium]
MNQTANEVLEFVKENDVRFIWLNFCDLLGNQKRLSIMADELESALKNGVSFDPRAVCGFGDASQADLFLFPDPSTLMVMPWRPSPGRVIRFYCDVKNPDGALCEHDSRNILKKVVRHYENMGYVCKVGAECEFYLFKTNEDGEPTDTPLDKGGYLDMYPLDLGGDIRREICLTLEEMGIKPESSHHEQGPGQNEVVFKFSDALSSADNLQSFKTVVKTIAARNGLFASFMPKPLLEFPGSGMHINISLAKNGINIFKNIEERQSNVAESFIAGILARIPEFTIFLNPIANSYERFGKFEAPAYVSWSFQNRSQLIRIPTASGEKVRMELLSPDPSTNPYLAYALIIAAGIEGIEKSMVLSAAVNVDLYTTEGDITKALTPLPVNMDEAIKLAENSDFVRSVIGNELLLKYISIKKREAEDFLVANDKAEFYKKRYFGTI